MPHLGLYLCRLFPPSALALTATEPESASRSAEVRKNLKYEGLCDRYFFQAMAIETSCVFGRDTNAFISRLGHLTTSISGQRRKAEYVTCNSPWKRPISNTSWPPKLMNWDCLVLYVNCTLLSLHYVYILFMFVSIHTLSIQSLSWSMLLKIK